MLWPGSPLSDMVQYLWAVPRYDQDDYGEDDYDDDQSDGGY